LGGILFTPKLLPNLRDGIGPKTTDIFSTHNYKFNYENSE